MPFFPYDYWPVRLHQVKAEAFEGWLIGVTSEASAVEAVCIGFGVASRD
jgi:hypothetical protein